MTPVGGSGGSAAPDPDNSPTTAVVWHQGLVTRSDRLEVTGGVGCTIWLTGLSGSGKSTIAHEAERQLISEGRAAYVLDGDNLRHGLCADLGFGAAARDENVRRVAEVARLLADAGLVVIVALVSPYRQARQSARRLHEAAGLPFAEVFVDTPIEECRRRDPKGLYAASDTGTLKGLTGVDDPYEPPLDPDLRLDATSAPVADLARSVVALAR